MKETNSKDMVVDFREYLELEPYIQFTHDEDVDEGMELDEENLIEGGYVESPFKPIEMGDYTLTLYASTHNFCTPAMNSFNKYLYQQWELCIEKVHSKYGYVVCTAEVMNELGFEDFEPNDYYVAYCDVDLVQEIFDHLVDKLKLPKI